MDGVWKVGNEAPRPAASMRIVSIGERAVEEVDRSPRRVGVTELRGNLTGWLRQVQRGQVLLVTSGDRIVAELHPPTVDRPPAREPGRLRGRIRMAEDFDQLPPDVLDAIEGNP